MSYAEALQEMFPDLDPAVDDLFLLEPHQITHLPERAPARELAAVLHAERVVARVDAEALGGEVALQTDEVGLELPALLEPRLDAVDPEVEDLAFVAVGLQGPGDALEPQGLDEGDHLEAEDAAGVRLQEGDFHGGVS